MDMLYELRLYVTHPGRFPILHDQWESDHFAIYADYHTVLGSFDALNRDEDSIAGAGDQVGVAVFLEHDDRAAVDRSMNALIASNRMNEIGGPPGTTIVHHWERTFLYPLATEADLLQREASPTAVYEMRFIDVATDDLDDATEQWTAKLYDELRTDHDVRGLFVAHPESSAMPTGNAVLLRHADLATAQASLGLKPGAGVRRQLLRPMAVSPMQ